MRARTCSAAVWTCSSFASALISADAAPFDIVTNATRAATARTAASSCLTASISRFCAAGWVACSASSAIAPGDTGRARSVAKSSAAAVATDMNWPANAARTIATVSFIAGSDFLRVVTLS